MSQIPIVKNVLLGLGTFLGFWILAIGLRFASFFLNPVFFLVVAYIPVALILTIVLWFRKRQAIAIGIVAAILLNFFMWIRLEPTSIYQFLIPYFFISE